MEIIIAKTAGFCFGVRRAVEQVYKEAENGHIYTYGPIIHNKEVTGALAQKGVEAIDSLEGIADGTVILRSHGVPPDVYDALAARGLCYKDCTCPDVKKIHRIVQEEVAKGQKIIIIGNPNHPEIIGINGWANNEAIILNSLQEIGDFPFDLRYNYSIVVQTTFEYKAFETILNALDERKIKRTVFNTICKATVQRQTEAEEIARRVDIMLVIGDKGSANTQRLFEICKAHCKRAHFIETIHDLQLNILSPSDRIGITAGASTPPATIKEAIILMSELENNSSSQSFEEMLNETFVTLHTGDIVKGTVIQVSNGEVSVNLGYKSDGLIQKGEFSDDPDIDPADHVKSGDEIEVFIIRVNDGEGNVLLSKKRVDSQKGLEDIEAAVEAGTIFKGKVIEIVKGGLIVIINGIRAFVPSSQISHRFVEDMNVFKGQELDFNVLEVDKTKRRVIAGRKDLARKQLAEQKEKVFSSIEVGQKLDGTVSRIVDFGAFVDLGGVDGLIHISELSWGRVKKVTDVLKEGDKVSVNVLEINKDKEKISLSLRNVEDNPWTRAAERYAVGNIVGGKVVRMVPFGAFVELEEGIDGLVHISQISAKRVEKPEDELSIGQIITVKVTELNLDDKKISLSKKAAEAPAETPEDTSAAQTPTEAVAEAQTEEVIAEAVEAIVDEVVSDEVATDESVADEVVVDETATDEVVADEAVTEAEVTEE